MAEAVVEERQLLKTLRWYDGFVICLANPGFLLGSLGFSVLDLGGWGAAMIWGITAAIVFPVTIIYSELAAMFPNKSGGVSIYANEALAQVHDAHRARSRRSATGSAGRWCCRSSASSPATSPRPPGSRGEPYGTYAFGGAKTRQRVLQHRQRPHRAPAPDRHRPDPLPSGPSTSSARGSPWRSTTSPGILLMIPLFCFTLLPFLNGDFHSSNLTYKLNDPGLAWGACRSRSSGSGS